MTTTQFSARRYYNGTELAGYLFGYSEMHTNEQDQYIANEILLAATDVDIYSLDDDALDGLASAMIVGVGPSSVATRAELDWYAMLAVLGFCGPEPVCTAEVVYPVFTHEQRGNLYATLVPRFLGLAA